MVIGFFIQPRNGSLFEKKKEAVKKYNLVQLKQQLFQEYCFDQKLEQKTCKQVAKLASPLYSGLTVEDPKKKIDDLLKDLEKESKNKKPKERIPPEKKKDKKHKTKEIKKITLKQVIKAKRKDKLYPFKKILSKFIVDMGYGKFKDYQKFPVFKKFQINQRKYIQSLKSMYLKEHHFSTLTQTPTAAVHSVFRHANLMHILGNMVVIIGLGRYVEMFFGPLLTFIIFLLGGVGGAYAFAQFSPPYEIVPLVGASGGASTLMGAFLVLFRSRKIKFLVLPFPHEMFIVHIPPTLLLPIFLLAGDLSGINADVLQSGSVAYWAHLGGFVVGLLPAILYLNLKSISWPMLYPFEQNEVKGVLREKNLDAKIREARRILQYNEDNIYVKVELLCQLVSIPPTQQSVLYLRKYLQTTLALCLHHDKTKWALMLLRYIPTHFPIHKYLNRLGQENTLKLANYALQNGEYWVSVRMLNSFLSRFDDAYMAREIWQKSLGHLKLAHQQPEQWQLVKEMNASQGLECFSVMVEDLDKSVVAAAEGSEVVDGNLAMDSQGPGVSSGSPESPNQDIDPKHYLLKVREDYHLYQNAIPFKRGMAFFIDFVVQSALIELLTKTLPSSWESVLPIWRVICIIGVFCVYTLIPTLKSGQTMGKKAYGIRVVPMLHGRPLTLLQVLFREVTKYIQLFSFSLLYLQIFFHQQHRTLYDLMTKVKVIDYRDNPQAAEEEREFWGNQPQANNL